MARKHSDCQYIHGRPVDGHWLSSAFGGCGDILDEHMDLPAFFVPASGLEFQKLEERLVTGEAN